MKKLKGVNVYKILIFLLIISCSNIVPQVNNDIDVLQIYITEYKEKFNKKDVFIARDNSNNLVFKRYQEHLASIEGNSLIAIDSLLTELFSNSQYQNYKKQTITDSKWGFSLNNDNIHFANEKTKRNEIIYVSKPIYTLDGNYALIYSIIKGNNGVYFTPPIEVYIVDKKKLWKHIYTISASKFHPSGA